MADDSREEIIKDLPEEVKLLLQFEVLKELKRQNPLAMSERKERVGEHSWHLALSVLLLAEFASEPIDIARAALLAIDARGPFRQRNGRVPTDRLELHERGTLVVEPARRALGSGPQAAGLRA